NRGVASIDLVRTAFSPSVANTLATSLLQHDPITLSKTRRRSPDRSCKDGLQSVRFENVSTPLSLTTSLPNANHSPHPTPEMLPRIHTVRTDFSPSVSKLASTLTLATHSHLDKPRVSDCSGKPTAPRSRRSR